MNAGIYDTEHFETTHALIRLLDDGNNKITIFIVADLAPALKKMVQSEGIEYEWHFLQRNKLINSFIIYRYCKRNKIDILFLNTVSQHHILFGLLCIFLKKIKTVFTIHDANSLFKPQFKLGFSSALRYAGKKLLTKNVTHFATLLSSTRQYVQETFRPKQDVICIPGSFFETEGYQSTGTFLKIVVPGSVDFKRRNYDFILQLLGYLSQKNKIQIVLLGGRDENNKSILTQFKALNSDLVTIKTYDQPFIDTGEYETQLKTSDFILAPIQKYFEGESSIPEEYGVTKSSGSFFDAIRFGKPLLLSTDIIIPEEIEQQCIRYQSVEELARFFEDLNPEKKIQYHQMALSNALNFTVENTRKRLPMLFNSHINL